MPKLAVHSKLGRLVSESGTKTGTADPAVSVRVRRKLAEGEGFEPPRASRPGGFQVRPGSPLRMSSSYLMVSFRAVSSMSRPREGPMATDDDRCVRLRIRQRKRAAFVP